MLTDDTPVKVVLSEIFLKDIKDLAKSYRSVRKDILPLINKLCDGEIIGDRLKGFDYQVYKVRVKNSDNQKGASGGYRVIYYVKTTEIVTQDFGDWIVNESLRHIPAPVTKIGRTSFSISKTRFSSTTGSRKRSTLNMFLRGNAKKIRELKAMVAKVGYVLQPGRGKGSNTYSILNIISNILKI